MTLGDQLCVSLLGSWISVAPIHELDAAAVDALHGAVSDLRAIGVDRIAVDVRDVHDVRRDAAMELTRLQLRSFEDGWDFALVAGSPVVDDVFADLGVDALFEFVDSSGEPVR